MSKRKVYEDTQQFQSVWTELLRKQQGMTARLEAAKPALTALAESLGDVDGGKDVTVGKLLSRFGKQFDPLKIYPCSWWQDIGFETDDYWLRRLVHPKNGYAGWAESHFIRDIFTEVLSFSIPTAEAMKAIVGFTNGSLIEEYMAGSGYWAYLLRTHFGQEVEASDLNRGHFNLAQCRTFIPLLKKDVRKVKPRPDSTVMMSWIPYGDDCADNLLLDRMQTDQKLIMIGEEGGCCAADSTFEILENHFERVETVKLVQFPGLHDRMTFYRRR